MRTPIGYSRADELYDVQRVAAWRGRNDTRIINASGCTRYSLSATASAMAHGHTAAFCLRTECHRLELTDELLKSLIKGKFFHITPIHLYPAYYSFHFQALSRHVTSQDQNIRGLRVKACSPRTEPPFSIPRSDRWICFMHSRVFPHTLRNPRLFQQ